MFPQQRHVRGKNSLKKSINIFVVIYRKKSIFAKRIQRYKEYYKYTNRTKKWKQKVQQKSLCCYVLYW